MIRSRLTVFLLLLPWILTFLIFWVFPLLFSFIAGLTDYSLLARDSFRWAGLDNYRELLSDGHFRAAVKNTFIFVVGTVPLTTVIALGLALLVNRQFRGRGLFRAGYFLPSITSRLF